MRPTVRNCQAANVRIRARSAGDGLPISAATVRERTVARTRKSTGWPTTSGICTKERWLGRAPHLFHSTLEGSQKRHVRCICRNV